MVFSSYKKQRILYFYLKGYKAPTISRLLREEKLIASRVGVAKFLRKYEETGCITRTTGSGRPSKITEEIKALVETKMRKDDETTACQLHAFLVDHGYRFSLRMILRCRTSLGWTFRGSAYCQLIREENKVKRLQWARTHVNDDFENVVWTDECSVQLETHRRFCCRKRGESPRPKPMYVWFHFCVIACLSSLARCSRVLIIAHHLFLIHCTSTCRAKHPVKVNVWVGISMRGRTGICIFEGIMDAPLYLQVLQQTLIPFLDEVYPNSHRFMADNDPKHTSRAAHQFLQENGVGWWRTPAESPDLNPIENLWHELKE